MKPPSWRSAGALGAPSSVISAGVQLLAGPGTRYQDLGPDYYERQASIRRQIAHHVGKLGALGFEVTLCRIPEPDPDPAGQTQAA